MNLMDWLLVVILAHCPPLSLRKVLYVYILESLDCNYQIDDARSSIEDREAVEGKGEGSEDAKIRIICGGSNTTGRSKIFEMMRIMRPKRNSMKGRLV